jgi:hypothetical protein
VLPPNSVSPVPQKFTHEDTKEVVQERYEDAQLPTEVPTEGVRKLSRKSRLDAISEANILEQNTHIEKVVLSEENLPALWIQFLEEYKENINASYLGTFTSLNPQCIDNQNIEFCVSSSIIKGYLDSIRVDMHTFFKKQLSHTCTITIRVEINEEDIRNKPKTPKERYITILEKNPSLKDLVEKLNLELEL